VTGPIDRSPAGEGRWRWHLQLLTSGLVVGLALSSCSLVGDDDDGPGDATGDGSIRVLVVGDSVTVLSEEELRGELGWADQVDIRAHSGWRTDELLDGARSGAAEGPDIGVFLPGYNDVLQDRVDTPALDDMMAVAADLPCAVWFLLPTDGGYSSNLVEVWNARVERAAAEHPTVSISNDWKRLVEESPDFTFLSEADAVHPNRDGQRALATAMSQEARRRCR
jgi:lysophospholipase L1-like esterase